MTSKPTGTVTFLFTDIENSTKLARESPNSWEAAWARHHAILREAIEGANGFIFQDLGDSICASFHKAGDALKAALKSQQDLQHEPWSEVSIRVRMGIHTGEAESIGNDYSGYLTLSLVKRIMSAGHGGQILVSSTSENLLREQLPQHISLRDIGIHKFIHMPNAVHIFQVIAPDLPKDFPPLRTLDNLPNNLPAQLTSFVGREKELVDVKNLLNNTHILTLIGSGGTGKTRLSIQAASEMLEQYPDGVWLVQLAPILDPLLVPRTTATAIGLRDEPPRPVTDILCDYLSEKKILIILDNCEHLVEACARMADRILHAAPNAQILASSREALAIGGEVTYRVPSLELPDLSHLPPIESLSQYEAVKLFIDRAKSAVSTFTVTNENAPALAQVCHYLDGIPLAIELAAAKVRVLSMEQIVQRLDDRFRLLTGGSRTALERHQTLRATIDWSHNLLSPIEQILFRRLSCFVGGWTLEAAESVCESGPIKSDDVLSLIEQLINKSLVLTEEASHETRYHMLETIRQYANEKLLESVENDALRNRHLEYFLKFAEVTEPKLRSEDQERWLSQLEMEHNNIRAALEWSLVAHNKNESGLRLSSALVTFWLIHGYLREGQTWLEQLLTLNSDAPAIIRAKALTGAGTLAWGMSDYSRAVALHQDSLALYRALYNQRGIAEALTNLGVQALAQGNFEQAMQQLEESLKLYRTLNDKVGTADALMCLGEVHRYTGDPEVAAVCYAESLTLYRELGDQRWIAGALHNLGLAAIDQGDSKQALLYHQESLGLFQRLGEKQYLPESLEALADIFGVRRQSEPAARLLGASEAFREVLQIPLRPAERSDYDDVLALVRAQLDKLDTSAFADAWIAGQRMAAEGWEKVIAYALAQASLGKPETTTKTEPGPASLPSQREAEKQKYGGLTSRECEVAAQIAQGKSNQVIAVELFVGLKTVEAHVTRILSKLGFTSRAQIAAWAVSKGLAAAPTDLDTFSREG
jgi:predicted ATPase/class 3 adenylate cyclase/DNA-binding CsgD family transcriptional regulator